MFLLTGGFQRTFLIPKLVIDMINSNWTSCHAIQEVIVLVISNRPRSNYYHKLPESSG